jgi:four helix bundle protein
MEFKRFLEIAIGSSFELETQLTIIQELKMLEATEIIPIQEHIQILQKQVNKLITAISTNNQKLKANSQ